jgi:hypothetical protein
LDQSGIFLLQDIDLALQILDLPLEQLDLLLEARDLGIHWGVGSRGHSRASGLLLTQPTDRGGGADDQHQKQQGRGGFHAWL